MTRDLYTETPKVSRKMGSVPPPFLRTYPTKRYQTPFLIVLQCSSFILNFPFPLNFSYVDPKERSPYDSCPIPRHNFYVILPGVIGTSEPAGDVCSRGSTPAFSVVFMCTSGKDPVAVPFEYTGYLVYGGTYVLCPLVDVLLFV